MKLRGVAGYVETFLLVGVAMLGASIVFASTQRYAGTAQGSPVSASDFTLKQGSTYAVLRFVVSNTGNSAAPSFFVSISGTAPGAAYCYTVSDASTLAVLGTSCPSFAPLPASLTVPAQLKSGSSVVAELILSGTGLSPGQRVSVVVGTPNGGLSSQSVLVIPS